MKTVIYLDNSATTRVFDSSAQVAMHYMTTEHFNPSSMYGPAVAVEREVSRVRREMAASLGASEEELYFTSGGTESDNIAILGSAAVLRPGRWRFITTAIEHPAVYDVFGALEKAGHEVIRLPVNSAGMIDLEELSSLVDERTALVSVMHVNNEIGSIEDLSAIERIIHKRNPAALFHSDGVQAFGKMPFGKMPADLYSISGHKFHAPKGVGALLMRKHVKNAGGQIGGGQERGMRSGTTNAPGILAMGDAFSIMYKNQQANAQHMMNCKIRLCENLSAIPDVYFNGPRPEEGAPHILNVSFLGVRGEVLLHALEEQEIYVSTGSACSSHKRGKNRILSAIGVEGARAEGAIRFSLSPLNTEEEMNRASEAIEASVKTLRRFRRR